MSARDELITARDKLHAAAGFITHALEGRDRGFTMADCIDAADRLLDVVAGHLRAAKGTEEAHEHGG